MNDELIHRGANGTTTEVLVIGYGSLLRSDDGVGQRVADAVAQRRWPGVGSICATQLTPELAANIAGAQLVIFVDAAHDGSAPPGAVRCVPVVCATPVSAPLTHHCTPQRILSLAQNLYGRAPQAHLLTVQAASMALGDTLSPEVEQAVADALQVIQAVVFAG